MYHKRKLWCILVCQHDIITHPPNLLDRFSLLLNKLSNIFLAHNFWCSFNSSVIILCSERPAFDRQALAHVSVVTPGSILQTCTGEQGFQYFGYVHVFGFSRWRIQNMFKQTCSSQLVQTHFLHENPSFFPSNIYVGLSPIIVSPSSLEFPLQK